MGTQGTIRQKEYRYPVFWTETTWNSNKDHGVRLILWKTEVGEGHPKRQGVGSLLNTSYGRPGLRTRCNYVPTLSSRRYYSVPLHILPYNLESTSTRTTGRATWGVGGLPGFTGRNLKEVVSNFKPRTECQKPIRVFQRRLRDPTKFLRSNVDYHPFVVDLFVSGTESLVLYLH